MLQNGQAAGFFALPVQNPREGFTPPGPDLGSFAPDFDLVDLKGRRVRLSDFRGKPVVLALGSYT